MALILKYLGGKWGIVAGVIWAVAGFLVKSQFFTDDCSQITNDFLTAANSQQAQNAAQIDQDIEDRDAAVTQAAQDRGTLAGQANRLAIENATAEAATCPPSESLLNVISGHKKTRD